METKKKEFSTLDVERILNIKRGRLVHWMKGEFIPGKLVKWGRGYKTVFSLYDLYSIALFKKFVDFSLSRELAKEYIGYVKWEKIIKNKFKFMFVQYIKPFVKQEHGPNAGRYKREGRINVDFFGDREALYKISGSRIGIFIDIEWIVKTVNGRV